MRQDDYAPLGAIVFSPWQTKVNSHQALEKVEIARVKLLRRRIQFREEADVVVPFACRVPEPLGQRERTVAAHVIADRHYESAGHKNVWGACTKSKCGNLPPAP